MKLYFVVAVLQNIRTKNEKLRFVDVCEQAERKRMSEMCLIIKAVPEDFKKRRV